MKPRTLTRHFRESFKSLHRNGLMTFAAISAVTVTLVLVGFFMITMLNVNKLATDVEDNVKINANIDLAATKKDEAKVEKELQKLTGVEKVTFSSKNNELKKMIKAYGDSFELFEQSNPLHDVYVIEAKTPSDVEKVALAAEKVTNIDSVSYNAKTVGKVFDVVKWVRYIGVFLIAALLLTAMFLISNTIKIAIYSRRTEVEIQKLVGATNGFIRWPFLLEGAWIGLFGAIIPIGLTWLVYYQVYKWMMPTLAPTYYSLLPVGQMVGIVSITALLIGILVGMFGSVLSIRKFLKI
ncbi:permease-like cell division protein FtsX [Brochothrix campestris]|uniref:Cell division protein FtsX n=1 Tax=Brochothrix campestris FSL F6-1037 TaxID=1265861 RepID=W7CSZ2_9LIST|nr:permease-like cell division protein FtsX [Brochothrix campestris]EUJ40027.1 cell division ABC transporter permease [Brochothrix campestris FSL F6-1037]